MRSLLADHLLQRLQQQTEGALYQRVFRCLRDAMIEDVLPPKTRLPASRDLAHELNVSRNTILNAYEQLRAQGYVEAFTGSGTWVCEKLPEDYLNVLSAETTPQQNTSYDLKNLSQRGMVFLKMLQHHLINGVPLSYGVPDVTEFPHAEFSKIFYRLSRQPNIANLIYTSDGGCLELKQALAEYLRVVRSVKCDAEQILITDGIHQAVDFISRALCDVDEHVWVEEIRLLGSQKYFTYEWSKYSCDAC